MRPFMIVIAWLLLTGSLFAWFYSDRYAVSKDSVRKVIQPYLLVTILAAAAVRYSQWKDPDLLFQAALLKFCASLPSLLFVLKGHLILKSSFGKYICLAVAFGLIADVAINVSPITGAVTFGLGHLMYDIAFIKEKKPSQKQIILWLVLSVIALVPVIMLKDRVSSWVLAAVGWIYLSILISTVVFSWNLERLVFIAACVFAFSDLMLIYNTANDSGILLQFAALVIYYGSLLLYGAAVWKRSLRRTGSK